MHISIGLSQFSGAALLGGADLRTGLAWGPFSGHLPTGVVVCVAVLGRDEAEEEKP